MRTLGNIIWAILVGWWMALGYLFVGALACITIVLIPVGLQYFKFTKLVFAPFGKKIVYGGGFVKTGLNILWILIGGFEIALTHFLLGIALCCTIIFIPLGLQSFKFAKLAFMPLGAKVVSEN